MSWSENITKIDSATKKKRDRRNNIHFVLSVLVVIVMVRQFFMANYNNVFICILTIVLFNIPTIADRTLKIKVPIVLETIILLFIFSAEILGEIQSFYTKIPFWDVILHAMNGFMMAAIGFSLIDILNQSPRIHMDLSPIFVAFVAFCFSMTIGVLWEFFEYGMDTLFLTDMQKDWYVGDVSSVLLNPSGLNDPILIRDVTKTVISGTIDGVSRDWVIDGAYLDIGLIDTMKDMIVNCIGAVIFSIIGYFYITNRGNGKLASKFIPILKTPEEIEETKKIYDERKNHKKNKRNKKQAK